jgi:hypothetical protein
VKADITEFLNMAYRKPCTVAVAETRLDAQERANFHAALKESAGLIPNAVLVRWLKQKTGAAVSPEALRKHREAACNCG